MRRLFVFCKIFLIIVVFYFVAEFAANAIFQLFNHQLSICSVETFG